MFKQCRLLLTSLVLFSSSLFATIHPYPGEWTLTGEFLYLKPSFDDTAFVLNSPAIASNSFVVGDRQHNDFDFKPGFRVALGYGFCDCFDFMIDYARLYASQRRTVSGTFLNPTNILNSFGAFEDYSGSAQSNLKLLYQRIDALFGIKFWDCCGFDLYFKGGLEYAYLKLNEKDFYFAATDVGFYKQRSKVWGIGPQAGLEFDYLICNFSRFCSGSLSLTGSTSGSILASRSKINLDVGDINGRIANVNDDSTWRLIPAFHSRVGLNFTKCFSCLAAALEVGYEFDTYIRGMGKIVFVDDVSYSNSFDQFTNYDLQGLYVSLTLGY